MLFFPDQHLGRNTAMSMGFEASSMVVWDPRKGLGGLEDVDVKQAAFLLWKGHCSVHQRFRTEHVAAFREAHPNGVVVVHPECSQEVVAVADLVGSTDFIIRTIEATQPGAVIGVGTEIHLVKRLADEHPDRTVECLDPNVCPCTTMSRIDAPHLAWVLEELVQGRVRNQISVDDATAADARIALERMLSISCCLLYTSPSPSRASRTRPSGRRPWCPGSSRRRRGSRGRRQRCRRAAPARCV